MFRAFWCALTHRDKHVYVEGGYMYRLWACRTCSRRWTESMR